MYRPGRDGCLHNEAGEVGAVVRVLRSAALNSEVATKPGRILYLARHGETEWNRLGRWQGHTDIPLTERGRAQALELGERLRSVTIDHVVASDLSRARDTARIVATMLGLTDVAEDPELRERMFGRFEGLTRAQCEVEHAADWARYRANPTIGPPGAESHDLVVSRMRRAVLRAASLPGRNAVLLVTHGGAMRILGNAEGDVGTDPIRNGELFRVELFANAGLRVLRMT